jgi:DNA-binding PadR family transcriptional regulator
MEENMFGSHFRNFDRHSNPFERQSRLFKKGDLKYVILDLLKDKPAHGYEITQALEDRFHGMYSPSAGSVYPILQLLEDMGYVTSNVTEGKKVYTITDSGKKFLEEQKETTDNIKGRLGGWWGSENREYLQDVGVTMNYSRDINMAIRHIAVRKDPAKISRVNEILAKTLKDIEQIHQER